MLQLCVNKHKLTQMNSVGVGAGVVVNGARVGRWS